MTDQDFYEFQTNVEASAVSYENQEDGTTIITCQDGVKLLVTADGDSRPLLQGKVMENTQTVANKHFAVVDAPGFGSSGILNIYSVHGTAAEAKAAANNRRSRWAISMPASWTDSSFRVGETVYDDMVGRQYRRVGEE